MNGLTVRRVHNGMNPALETFMNTALKLTKPLLALGVIATFFLAPEAAKADDLDPLPGGGFGDGPVVSHLETTVSHCSSSRYRYAECAFPGTILMAEVERRASHAPCVLNRSFGFKGNILWVKAGCRADFEVTYVDPTRPDDGPIVLPLPN
jgi:hypothetical protein